MTNNERVIASGNGQIGFSTTGGQTWTIPQSAILGRVEVAYAPSNPMTAYALVDQNNGDLYRSTDGGQNYTLVNTGTNFFLSPGPPPSSQGFYDNIIWVNPLDPTFVIVGGIELWRSTDCGTINPSTGQVQCNFTQISRWQDAPASSAHADHHMIVAHPGFNNTNNRTAFFGNDGGIYSAGDVATVAQTSGWTNLNNNLGITQFYGAAANYNGIFIGGAQDNATLRKPFGFSQAWFGINGLGGDGGFCASDPTDPNFFYGEYVYQQISRSNNAGVSGNRIDNGLTDANNPANSNFIAPFILDPNDPNTMLAGGLSLWRTSNVKALAPTWTAIKQPVPPPPPPNNDVRISAIAVSPDNPDLILVGHNNGNIYRNFTGTGSAPIWTQIDTIALPNRFVTRLVINNTRFPGWIYATFGGFNADNVYRSTDLGTTWADITGTGATGLPNVPVRSLVFHPRNPNFLYVGTEVGIFTSEDAGANWAVPQDGPANVSVDELFWFRSGAELYPSDLIAVTHGRGLYRASFGIYVDCNYMGIEHGTFTQPYRTITAAINATTRYQTIWIRPCNYNEAIITNKRLELRSLGGTAVIGRP